MCHSASLPIDSPGRGILTGISAGCKRCRDYLKLILNATIIPNAASLEGHECRCTKLHLWPRVRLLSQFRVKCTRSSSTAMHAHGRIQWTSGQPGLNGVKAKDTIWIMTSWCKHSVFTEHSAVCLRCHSPTLCDSDSLLWTRSSHSRPKMDANDNYDHVFKILLVGARSNLLVIVSRHTEMVVGSSDFQSSGATDPCAADDPHCLQGTLALERVPCF